MKVKVFNRGPNPVGSYKKMSGGMAGDIIELAPREMTVVDVEVANVLVANNPTLEIVGPADSSKDGKKTSGKKYIATE